MDVHRSRSNLFDLRPKTYQYNTLGGRPTRRAREIRRQGFQCGSPRRRVPKGVPKFANTPHSWGMPDTWFWRVLAPKSRVLVQRNPSPGEPFPRNLVWSGLTRAAMLDGVPRQVLRGGRERTTRFVCVKLGVHFRQLYLLPDIIYFTHPCAEL